MQVKRSQHQPQYLLTLLLAASKSKLHEDKFLPFWDDVVNRRVCTSCHLTQFLHQIGSLWKLGARRSPCGGFFVIWYHKVWHNWWYPFQGLCGDCGRFSWLLWWRYFHRASQLPLQAPWKFTMVVRIPGITSCVQSMRITPRVITYPPWGSSTTSPVSPTLPASPPQWTHPRRTLKKMHMYKL